MFIEHLLDAKHCPKYFINIITFNLYNPTLSPFHREGIKVYEREENQSH